MGSNRTRLVVVTVLVRDNACDETTNCAEITENVIIEGGKARGRKAMDVKTNNVTYIHTNKKDRAK